MQKGEFFSILKSHSAEGKSVPSGFQQPHHSAAKLAARLPAKLWGDLVKDGEWGGKLWLNVH